MDIKEKAAALHDQGFNCGQSVFCACGEFAGLDKNAALALSGGIGGGFRCGEICGAAAGAVLALGLAYPFNTAGDAGAKDKIAEVTKKYTAAFKEKFGCIRCEELKVSGAPCADLIAYAAQLADEMIKESRGE